MEVKGIRALSCTAAALGLLYAAAPAMAQEKLTVWWVKGFYKSEDDALFAAIKKFEAKTGVKVELSQYAVQDMIPKTVAALDSGNAARRRLCRHLRLPGHRQVGVRRQARGPLRHPRRR